MESIQYYFNVKSDDPVLNNTISLIELNNTILQDSKSNLSILQ